MLADRVRMKNIGAVDAPGSSTLIAGDMTEGFFGEVSSAELISGDALASEVGLSAGTSQYSTEPWLKFAIDNKILFVAKKPFRHSIRWDDINAANCVYGGNTIQIDGLTYKVRLMKGASTDPYNDKATDEGAIGSEWNRLMLPIHIKAPSDWFSYFQDYVDSPTKDWGIDYTDGDLSTGDGNYSWCQETASNSDYRCVRGGETEVTFTNIMYKAYNSPDLMWRPVLELVQ